MIDLTKRLVDVLQQLDCNDIDRAKQSIKNIIVDINDPIACSKSFIEIDKDDWAAIAQEFDEAFDHPDEAGGLHYDNGAFYFGSAPSNESLLDKLPEITIIEPKG